MASINLNEELVEHGYASRTASIGMVRRPARITYWISKEQPKVGSTYWAIGSWLDTKGQFYLQEVGNQPELERIRTYLNGKYHGTKATDADLLCTVGDLCIAKYDISVF